MYDNVSPSLLTSMHSFTQCIVKFHNEEKNFRKEYVEIGGKGDRFTMHFMKWENKNSYFVHG
jgi:hypothetical protein